MIRCKYPSNAEEATNLVELFAELTRTVKFSEFQYMGEMMWHHWRNHGTAVLVLTTESVIDIRTKVGLGELMLAEVNDCAQMRAVSWMSYQFKENLFQGFRAAQ